MFEWLNMFSWLTSPSFILILCLFWYLFVSDRDVILAIAENFGRPTSYYKDKVVWITGASTGLGEAIAHELASVGAKLILSARNKHLLQNVKDICLHKSYGQLKEKDILMLPLDVTELKSHQKNVDTAIQYFGRVDIFVDNVGRFQIGNIHSTSIEVIKDLFEINYFGGIHLTQILLQHFLHKKRGQIIVVSSVAGKFGIPCSATYAATKHALQGFYDSLRIEYNNENIGVTIVNPGTFSSNIFNQALGIKKDEIIQDFMYNIHKMSSQRCAHLTLVAGANNLFEAWISYQPQLFFLWVSQYLPDVFKYGINLTFTKRRLKCLLDATYPDDILSWKPVFWRKS